MGKGSPVNKKASSDKVTKFQGGKAPPGGVNSKGVAGRPAKGMESTRPGSNSWK